MLKIVLTPFFSLRNDSPVPLINAFEVVLLLVPVS